MVLPDIAVSTEAMLMTSCPIGNRDVPRSSNAFGNAARRRHGQGRLLGQGPLGSNPGAPGPCSVQGKRKRTKPETQQPGSMGEKNESLSKMCVCSATNRSEASMDLQLPSTASSRRPFKSQKESGNQASTNHEVQFPLGSHLLYCLGSSVVHGNRTNLEVPNDGLHQVERVQV